MSKSSKLKKQIKGAQRKMVCIDGEVNSLYTERERFAPNRFSELLKIKSEAMVNCKQKIGFYQSELGN